jgi:hypothetical protein
LLEDARAETAGDFYCAVGRKRIDYDQLIAEGDRAREALPDEFLFVSRDHYREIVGRVVIAKRSRAMGGENGNNCLFTLDLRDWEQLCLLKVRIIASLYWVRCIGSTIATS